MANRKSYSLTNTSPVRTVTLESGIDGITEARKRISQVHDGLVSRGYVAKVKKANSLVVTSPKGVDHTITVA